MLNETLAWKMLFLQGMDALLSNLIRLESYNKASADAKNSLSVLVADDEMRMLHLLTITLKSLGHEVVGSADNGQDAVQLAAQHHPDLVILDLEMPKMDGFEAAERILEEASVPIIISTGKSDCESLHRAKNIDIQAYLVKPFSKAQLNSSISVALSQHQKLLAARVKIAALTNEIELVKAVDLAVTLLMEKFRIDRKEALEKLETAARVRNNTLAEVARAMIATLSPQDVQPEASAAQA
jgi:AmiR/NasT family two-component response regulator